VAGMNQTDQRVKVIVEVVAGRVPGKPILERTRQFVITFEEWVDADDQANLLANRNGEACGYAQYLMMQPDRLNWVRVDWIWL